MEPFRTSALRLLRSHVRLFDRILVHSEYYGDHMADQFEWAFVAPVATLKSGDKVVGKYYGGPTWEATDGSKVTGKQVAVAPAAAGAIPLQLVKANPAEGTGARWV